MHDEPPNQDSRAGSRPLLGGVFGRHFSARPEGSFYPRAELLPRLLARVTDLILAATLALVAPVPGLVLAALYLLFADGLMRGQSPGKRLMGIKVVIPDTREDASFRESALRNAPLVAALVLRLVPDWGDVLALGVGLGVATFEGLRVVTDGLGLRLGDLLAGTQVVDAKVVAGEQVRPLLKAVGPGRSHARGAVRVLLEPTRDSRSSP